MPRHPARPFRLVDSILATTFAVGCGPAEPPRTEQAPAAPPTITVHAHDYGFDAPDTVASGRAVWRLVNDGADLHHLQLVRLDGKTIDDVKAGFAPPGPFPEGIVPVGGPNATDPGGSGEATLSLEPGEYAIICVVDTPDHVPHIAKGMVRALTVTVGSTVAEPPLAPPDLTITLRDFAFEVPDTLRAGRQVIDVAVDGAEPHELVIVRLDPGATVDQLMAWGTTYQGELPGHMVPGVAMLSPGMSNRIVVDWTPGTYVLLCFVPAKADAQPHVMKGMMKVVTVT